MIEIFGCIFIITLGCIGHFIYEWSNENKICALFFAVNESTWEHIKLAIFPALMWMLIEIFYYYNNPNYIFARFASMTFMIIFIPFVFYLIKFLTKKSILIIDILEYIIAIVLGQYLFKFLINLPPFTKAYYYIGVIGILMIFIMLVTFTFFPLKNFLFIDPITKKYGLEATHKHHK